MVTLRKALRRIKGQLPRFLTERLIGSTCRAIGYRYRQRRLTPAVTLWLFAQQLWRGNVAVGELRRFSKLDFTDSAYCQARGRLPLAFFRRIQRAIFAQGQQQFRSDASGLWKDHRLMVLDGSSFSMPDTEELQEVFGQPSAQAPGCGFPVAHLLVQVDLHSGLLTEALAAVGNTHDMAHAAVTHRSLEDGDVLLGDRGFCSYAHLALLKQRDCHAVFRAHQRTIIDFTPHRLHAPPGQRSAEHRGMPCSRWVKQLGPNDQIVEYFKPIDRPNWMSEEEYAQLPDSLLVREVRFNVSKRKRRVNEVTLVTTLLDADKYPAEELAELYHLRWRVEVHLKHLKITLGLDVLRCQTLPGVMKELYLFITLYNLVRQVMCKAAKRQKQLPDRISFIDALRWLRYAELGEEIPKLKVVPLRDNRMEPRVRKRRPKQYDLMNKPRDVLKQQLANQ